MKFLFNATTNIAGGGAKNSAVFLRQALISNRHDWHFAVSPQVAEIVSAWDVPQSCMTVIEDTPARSYNARRALAALQRNGDFDLVYTMAGPAYTRFTCPHVMGISNPYISHVDRTTFLSTRPVARWLPDALKVAYQARHAREAQRLVFQTETARDSFCRRLRFPTRQTSVVSNAFDANSFAEISPAEFGNPLRILVPAMAYPHKMLDRVPTVAAACRDMFGQRKVEFYLTIEPDSREWKSISQAAARLSVSERVRTVGTYNYADVGKIFAQADIVLSLSVLETFSATPLEAFSAARPHISTDQPWAREISGGAALYVNPRDPGSVARAIGRLADDPALRERMILAGQAMLEKYGDQSTRFSKLVAILEEEAARHQR